LKLSEIHINPANPRLIKDERFKKLCQSIKEFPKMMKLRPIIVDKEGMILGGNMRFKALKELGYKEVPAEWIKRDGELTEAEKQRFIIADNIEQGEWDFEKLKDWDSDKLKEWGIDLSIWEGTQIIDSNYSRKIKAPIYEVKNEKPDIIELYNSDKYKDIIQKIENSNILESEKEFLKIAASRHIVFNYSNIADYYANSEKELQELMEDSALVIIDFNKAIELGYVKLSEEIAEQYKEEYGNEV